MMKLKLSSTILCIALLTAVDLNADVQGNFPLPESPAPTRSITGEKKKLSATLGRKWAGGTRLDYVQCKGVGYGLPVPHALDVDSVVVTVGDRVLVKGKDYEINSFYGTLSLAVGSIVSPDTAVSIDYVVGHRRIDSVVQTSAGDVVIRQGDPALVAPLPPQLTDGEKRLGNYFLDYFQTPEEADYFPCIETSDGAVTKTSGRNLIEVRQKLAAGQAVKIVCWGDSITFGGDASSKEMAYPEVLECRLKHLYPQSQITVKTIAIGGSQSRQWLYPDRYQHPTMQKNCRFDRILEEKPDVVTVEFLNDAYLSKKDVESAYTDMISRFKDAGIEVILITPNFTMPEMMNADNLRTQETRQYVIALQDFAQDNGIALADTSSRWEHLWKEGIPYVTMINNGINHVDDRGHAIYADEIIASIQDNTTNKLKDQ